MPKFEVAIYNQQVRDLVKVGERHKHLADDWGDTHYIEIVADNQDQARSKASVRYPQAAGYVIEQIVPALEL